MTNDEAKEQIKTYIKQYADEIAGAGKKVGQASYQYACPLCTSGHKRHKTGAFTIYTDTNRFKCFACGADGDIFSLIGQYEGISDFLSQLKFACSRFGVNIDEFNYLGGNGTENPQKPRTLEYSAKIETKQESKPKETTENKEQKDINKNYIAKCALNREKRDYLTQRGISAEIQRKFNIGYDLEKNLLIIPTSIYSYNARTITGEKSYKKSKGESELFNLKGIEKAKTPIFLVEGEIDALSIIEAGGEAVALSTTGSTKIIDYLSNHTITQPVIIALDNDSAGTLGAKKIFNALMEKNKNSFILSKYLYGEYKDANEALTNDTKAFKEKIQAIKDLESTKEALRKQNLKEYKKNNANTYFMDYFIHDIDKPKKPIPTGFQKLDNALNGGLYTGLYIIGAISSLGKTTFCLNIVDTLAEQGQDVLYISLEQARRELISKSLSRLTAIESIKDYNSTIWASRNIEILNYGSPEMRKQETKRELIGKAFSKYHLLSQNIYIMESVSGVKAVDIESQVKEHITITRKKPIVVIDYLQLLAPNDIKASDKQNMDSAVLTLKRLCRDYEITVIAISSFNRDNYNTSANLASFKESGIIEYSADVVIGLQYKGFELIAGEKDKERALRIQELLETNREKILLGQSIEIEAKILKNRNGERNSFIMNYYPKYNYFLESEQIAEREEQEEKEIPFI